MTLYLGVNKGKSEYDVASGTSTNTTDVEVVVNTTNVTSKHELVVALNNISNFIVRKLYPSSS